MESHCCFSCVPQHHILPQGVTSKTLFWFQTSLTFVGTYLKSDPSFSMRLFDLLRTYLLDNYWLWHGSNKGEGRSELSRDEKKIDETFLCLWVETNIAESASIFWSYEGLILARGFFFSRRLLVLIFPPFWQVCLFAIQARFFKLLAYFPYLFRGLMRFNEKLPLLRGGGSKNLEFGKKVSSLRTWKSVVHSKLSHRVSKVVFCVSGLGGAFEALCSNDIRGGVGIR